MTSYLFDNAAIQAAPRFTNLEALFDQRTFRALAATGVGPNWRCLEVGAGGGSVAAWLADRIGPDGHVLVTDIDLRHLHALDARRLANVEVRRHDIGRDPLPARTFDLIHARLVLVHVPQREEALAKLVEALTPGGWLVIEEFDSHFGDRSFATRNIADAALYGRMVAAQATLLERRGADLTWGRSLYRRFGELGLVELELDGALAVWHGGSAGARLYRANFEQIRAEAVAAGLMTDEEVDRVIALGEDPTFAYASPLALTVWGRLPGAHAQRAPTSREC